LSTFSGEGNRTNYLGIELLTDYLSPLEVVGYYNPLLGNIKDRE